MGQGGPGSPAEGPATSGEAVGWGSRNTPGLGGGDLGLLPASQSLGLFI